MHHADHSCRNGPRFLFLCYTDRRKASDKNRKGWETDGTGQRRKRSGREKPGCFCKTGIRFLKQRRLALAGAVYEGAESCGFGAAPFVCGGFSASAERETSQAGAAGAGGTLGAVPVCGCASAAGGHSGRRQHAAGGAESLYEKDAGAL